MAAIVADEAARLDPLQPLATALQHMPPPQPTGEIHVVVRVPTRWRSTKDPSFTVYNISELTEEEGQELLERLDIRVEEVAVEPSEHRPSAIPVFVWDKGGDQEQQQQEQPATDEQCVVIRIY